MIIFDIKRYAINDGPGIRTTVFVKGCPLRCVWCHNPESWLAQPEWLFKAQKCISCNTCGIHPEQMTYIRAHKALPAEADECPTQALEVCGRYYTLAQVLAEVEKERDVMLDSGGGVTISGGEPLFQVRDAADSELVSLLAELGRRGLHRCVDTTLFAPMATVEAVAAHTDLFLVDLKMMDAERHKRYTGVSNERILANLRRLAQMGKAFQIRIPLIEGVNADEANVEATACFVSRELRMPNGTLPCVALLPYHEMGRDKHTRRGTAYNPEAIVMSAPTDDVLQRCIDQFASHGIEAKVGG